MNILIIGCGKTAKAISEEIINEKYISNLYLYSRTEKSSKNLLNHLNNKKVKIINLDDIKNIDYIFLTLSNLSDKTRKNTFKDRDNTFDIRQDELKYNLGSIVDIITYLKYISNKTKIIVVTNPVDEITNFLKIILNNNKIYGFGLDLDSKRFSDYLNKEVYCIGTHGKAIPIINQKTNKDYDKIQKDIDNNLLNYIRKNGIPHKKAGIKFKEFFNNLNSKTTKTIHICKYITKPYLGVKDICVSLPYQVRNGKILNIKKMKVNDIEKKRFVKNVKELQKSTDHILKTYKNLIDYK